MIEFKGLRESLSLKSIRPELVSLLKLVAVWSARSQLDVRVTSLNDHDHSRPSEANPSAPMSLHYSDLACDFVISTRSGTPHKRGMSQLASFLRKHLSYGYDVIWNSPGHYTHIHVEWDDNQRPRTNAQ